MQGREKNEGLQTKPKLSCFSLAWSSLACWWFSRALAFRSLYYPRGKTTTSSPRRFSLGKQGILLVYNFYSSTGSCCSENTGSAGREGGGGTPVIRVEVWSMLSGTHTIYKKLKQQHTRFPWVGEREHSIVWPRRVCATAQHDVVSGLFQTLDLREYPPGMWTYD